MNIVNWEENMRQQTRQVFQPQISLSKLLHDLHKRLSNPKQSLTTSAQEFFRRQMSAYTSPVNLNHILSGPKVITHSV